jgi:hypothetical protein
MRLVLPKFLVVTGTVSRGSLATKRKWFPRLVILSGAVLLAGAYWLTPTGALYRVRSAHRIRKRQFRLGHAPGRQRHSMLIAWNRAIFAT